MEDSGATVPNVGPEGLCKILDVDAHEMAPTHLWGAMFGDNSAQFARAVSDVILCNFGPNSVVYPGLIDNADINPETVWNTKGPTAPGAFDFDRRVAVLDTMGIDRQLVFPTSALFSISILLAGAPLLEKFRLENTSEVDRMLRGVVNEYNDWALRTTTQHVDRYHAVAAIAAGSAEELIATATDLVGRGARALMLPGGVPPGGLSPADLDLDPLWSLLEEANVAVILHIGTDAGFRATERWASALPAFEPAKLDSAEITFDPFTASTVHMVPANFVTAMVLGGTFERHPRLRFGALELGSSWIGPLAEHLDVWANGPFRRRMSTILTMPPSAYIARNVRVTPFYFEPIDLYLKRYQALQSCYCYSSDYPHQEGGSDSKALFYAKIKPLGDEVVHRFFVSNGEWLLQSSGL